MDKAKSKDLKIRNAHITIFPDNHETNFSAEIINQYYDSTLVDMTKVTYYIIQGEYTKDKRQHLQIYAEFKNQMRYTEIKKAFNNQTIHIEPIKYGTQEQCINYCNDKYRDSEGNPKDIFREHKEIGIKKQAGKRTDLINTINQIKEGKSIDKLLMTDDIFAQQYTQYFRTFDKIEKLTKQQEVREQLIEKYKNIQFKPFQEEIINLLKEEPSERNIYWYYDYKGNIGKSFLTKYLSLTDDIFMISGGKKADILYAYSGQRTVIFDLPRDMSDKDYMYEVMETLKNGQYLSTKYQSEQRLYLTPHIIIFANWKPCRGMLSEDRIITKNINPQYTKDPNLFITDYEEIEDEL